MPNDISKKTPKPTLLTFKFQQWIDENREYLKPPVCNRQVIVDSGFIVKEVAGPNARDDYHYDEGEEFFYQLQGDMLLRTIQDGKRVDVTIREGEILLLPSGTPHSPQRFDNTVGLVIERQRNADELDGFMWYCDNCAALLNEEYLHVSDIVAQLPPVFDRFYTNPAHRTCSQCGTVKPDRDTA